MELPLRPYQQAAITAIEQAASDGVKRPVVALPTGTGKTVVFSHHLAQRGGRSLILAHRDELLQQARDKYLSVCDLPDDTDSIGIVRAEQDEHDRQVVIASVQTLSRDRRLARLTADFNTIVVDEAHHAPADTYRKVLEHVGSFDDGGPLTVGYTATPERGDKQGLDSVFQKIVYRRTIGDMVMAGYLSDIKAMRIYLQADFTKLRKVRGDFVDADVAKMLLGAHAPRKIAEAYTEYASGRKALVFTPTVALAELICGALCERGVAAEWLDGFTPREERRDILKRLKSGETKVVCNCGVLTEGFDEPSIDCIIMARPTQSKTLYIQCIGRGTRKFPGKDHCLVMDVCGVTEMHDLQSADHLFGKPLSQSGATLRESIAGEAADRDGVRMDTHLKAVLGDQRADGKRLVAIPVNLFTQGPMNWVQAGSKFVLPIAGGHLKLEAEGNDHWAIVHHRGADVAPVVVKGGLPLEYAQGFAEDFARSLGAGSAVLADRNAGWRQSPPSDKQLDVLRRMGVTVPPTMTRGQASDMITARVAARA